MKLPHPKNVQEALESVDMVIVQDVHAMDDKQLNFYKKCLESLLSYVRLMGEIYALANMKADHPEYSVEPVPAEPKPGDPK